MVGLHARPRSQPLRNLTAAIIMISMNIPAAAAAAEDPYLWLEEVSGERQLSQVRSWNARTAERLETSAGFTENRDRAARILNDPRQIAYPNLQKDRVTNFWQDANHVKGIWRTASLGAYLAGKPDWRTLVDVDALAKAEGKSWVWKGAVCLQSDYSRCMIGLSEGGSDALTYREFDMKAGRFLADGFTTPHAKTTLAWLSPDTLLVQTDFGAGTLTDSGYGRQVRMWKRGTPLKAAQVLLDGRKSDVGVSPSVEWDQGRAFAMIDRSPTFWTTELSHVTPDGRLVRSPLPDTATPEAVVDGRLVARLFADWKLGERTIPAGTVVAYDIAALERGEQPPIETVFSPDPATAIAQVGGGKGVVWLGLLEDVAGRLAAVRRTAAGWQVTDVPVPPNSAISIVDTDGRSDLAFVNIEGMIQPDTLVAARPGAELQTVAALPAQFDASQFEVAQRFATSADGTRVPYFLVRKKGASAPAPTLLHAYGGFRQPSLPTYLSPLPQFWLESGGAYVLANIRGGGEYGPSWHEAGLKENRQRVFDDFHAVAADLKATGITSTIAASGRSNGGLLVGVAFTQRPELYDAVLMGVPLADMRRYNQLLAGASWMGEYGNPDVPAEWEYISKYSPYQNLRKGGRYPRVMIFTSTKDDRVHPAHARKMAARLQELGDDFYYYENIQGGHAGTADKMEEAYRVALLYAYLDRELRSGPPSPPTAGQ